MPETIMIIDDDRAIAQLTSLWVKAAGFKAIIANDGQSGLLAIERYRPDLILLDIRMPEMDGFEVNRHLRQTPELANIPVIFLSAHAQETTRNESLEGGARCFLSKPYEVKSLTAAIRAVLKGNLAPEGSSYSQLNDQGVSQCPAKQS
jgi:DNA-binding response OmpR family regulator